jgi:hypothetical protein
LNRYVLVLSDGAPYVRVALFVMPGERLTCLQM